MSEMKLHRYDNQFLRDFRSPIVVNKKALAEQEVIEVAPPPPVFAESDMEHARDAAKKIGYAEGFEAGLAQANTEAAGTARDLAHHMARIEDHVSRLVAQYHELITAQSSELSQLVLMIARKVAGEALDANAAAAVTELVRRCLPMVYGKPRVAIELAPAMLAGVEAVLHRQLEKSGFEGDIEFRAVDGMEPSDVRIDWGNGAANRSTASIWQEIEALLQQVPLSPTLPTVTATNNATTETGATHG